MIRSLSKSVFGKSFATRSSHKLEEIHVSQLASLNDLLIHVDANDKVLGPLNKLEGHLPEAINSGVFHRAFSVFLFSAGSHKLLIQKRASTKLAFPREWANTCCSHPLYSPEDMANVDGNQIGIKRAASRRLNAELGLSSIKSFAFKEKIVYAQLSPGGSFGESEVDYILLSRMPLPQVNPNKDEVEQFEWISPGPENDRLGPLRQFLSEENQKGFPPTPWFDLMVTDPECLELWWNSIIIKGDAYLKDTKEKTVRDFRHIR